MTSHRSRAADAARPLLDVANVAHRLSASEEHVRRLLRDGKLPAIKVGKRWRVDPLELQAFIDARRVAVGG